MRQLTGHPVIGAFAEYSKTRFLGALLLGARFVDNLPVLEKVNSHALTNSDEDPYGSWPEYKERFGEEWKDITFVTQDVSSVLESLSGELYPTVSLLLSSVKVLETKVWLLATGPRTYAQPNGEPPLHAHVWASNIGAAFATQLNTELHGKFESDFTNRVVLVATLLDPRIRTFRHPLRSATMNDVEWSLYQEVFSSISTRPYGEAGRERSIAQWMFSSAIELMRSRMKVQFDEEVAKLDKVKQGLVAQGKYHVMPLWSDLEAWATARPETLLYQGKPISSTIDPILFWKENTASATLKPLARMTLAVPASALSVERIWSVSDKVWEKHRNRLDIATAGRQIFVQQTWRIAHAMLLRGNLSADGRAFYESLLPWGKKK